MPNILHRGKVRDTYDLGDGRLLMIATDRLSAFDVVLPTGITDKGQVLNRISAFWFDRTENIVPNHFICLADSPDAAQYIDKSSIAGAVSEQIARQAMVVKRAERLDLESSSGVISPARLGLSTADRAPCQAWMLVQDWLKGRNSQSHSSLPQPRLKKAMTRTCPSKKYWTWLGRIWLDSLRRRAKRSSKRPTTSQGARESYWPTPKWNLA